MKLAGSLPVIPTPFFRGKVDYESLLKLFEHIFPELEGYSWCGSTGESVSLSTDERLELISFAAKNTPPGKLIVAGLAHTDLNEMTRLAHRAEQLGIAAGLVPSPYYFPNSFPMVLRFFQVLDRSVNLPLVLYDNPVYTKTWLPAEEILRLFDACNHLEAVKLTDHDLDKIPVLKRGGVPVFSGDDLVIFRSLLMGVVGSMIITPALFPGPFQTVVRTLRQGNRRKALRLFSDKILPFIHLHGIGDEISTTKALFKHLGIFRSDEVRPPLLPCTRERRKEVVLAYDICRRRAARQE